MGKNSTEIERDLERQRESLHRRVDRLEERIRSDAETTRDRINERRHEVTDTVPDQLNPSEVREHPKSLLLGAFGAGLTAGLVSDAAMSSKRSRDRDRDRERFERERYDRYGRWDREEERGGFTLGIIERTIGPAISTFQSEATEYIQDAVRDLFGGRTRSDNERRSDSRDDRRPQSRSEDEADKKATSRS
jgi:hypothetical protein